MVIFATVCKPLQPPAFRAEATPNIAKPAVSQIIAVGSMAAGFFANTYGF